MKEAAKINLFLANVRSSDLLSKQLPNILLNHTTMSRKYAVVTGGTKGIGRAIVETFSSEGLIPVVCARSKEDLDQLADELSAAGQEILVFRADVSKVTDVKSFADFVLKHCSTIDILVNNAGVFTPGSLLDEAEDALQNMLQTNLMSAYFLTRSLAPMMINAAKGHIFNMCSIASQIAYPNGGSYSISKFAMLGFSKILREELKEKGVKVSSIMPGATWSNSWEGVDLPESRLMQAQDIADVVLAAYKLSNSAVVEDIVIRPQLGDL